MPTDRKPPKKPRKDSYALKAPTPTVQSVFEDAVLGLELKDIADRYDLTVPILKKRFKRSPRMGYAQGKHDAAATIQ